MRGVRLDGRYVHLSELRVMATRKRPGRKPPDAETLAVVAGALADGISVRDMARTLGVTKMTISRWMRAYAETPAGRAAAFVKRKAAPPPAPEASPEGEDDEPFLATLQRLMRGYTRRMRECEAIGDTTTAQKIGRDAEALARTIARVQKGDAANADTFSIPRADIDATMDALRERVKAILDRALLCAECSRALSVAWGRGET